LELNSDNHLMVQVKHGDLDKMSVLFARYNKRLFGFFWHFNLDQTNCEDLVQTVFYRMIRYRSSFDETHSFKTWMFTLARNTLNDDFARIKKREIAYAEVFRGFEESSGGTDLTEQKLLVTKALNLISPESREILLLARYEELPYKEISVVLGISEANVKVRVHRAMKELKDVYLKLEK
jgi:RNA polymerase sigma factor (sigma-70 family)